MALKRILVEPKNALVKSWRAPRLHSIFMQTRWIRRATPERDGPKQRGRDAPPDILCCRSSTLMPFAASGVGCGRRSVAAPAPGALWRGPSTNLSIRKPTKPLGPRLPLSQWRQERHKPSDGLAQLAQGSGILTSSGWSDARIERTTRRIR
jgi:hypothetical protein